MTPARAEADTTQRKRLPSDRHGARCGRRRQREARVTQDTLSDVLRSVRLKGVLFFHVDCTEPWVTEAPAASAMARAVMPGSEHVMMYHVVLSGQCWGGVVGAPPVRLAAGDVIVFPHGDAHVLSSEPGMRATPNLDLYELRPPQLPFRLEHAGTKASAVAEPGRPGDASLLCGFLGCDRRPFNPLLANLPRVLHSKPEEASDGDGVGHFARLALAESSAKRPGGEAVLERMSEMMFVDLLRRYLERLPQDQGGWLAGLRDRYVGNVLALMHEKPAEHWTAESLASRVGLSRSALHERFVQIIGLPPMQYLLNWRMQLASQMLTASNAPLASVALDTGYESEAAFSRAFKRSVGMPPSVWRRSRRSARLPGAPASPPSGPLGALDLGAAC